MLMWFMCALKIVLVLFFSLFLFLQMVNNDGSLFFTCCSYGRLDTCMRCWGDACKFNLFHRLHQANKPICNERTEGKNRWMKWEKWHSLNFTCTKLKWKQEESIERFWSVMFKLFIYWNACCKGSFIPLFTLFSFLFFSKTRVKWICSWHDSGRLYVPSLLCRIFWSI